MKLVRQLLPARRNWIAGLAQLTGVGTWLAGAYFVVFVVPRRVMCVYGESKTEVAMLAETDMVRTAYPAWLSAHPRQHCPPRLDVLVPYMNHKDTKDPWGNWYVMTCAPATGPLVISSAGEDGTFGTADDIRSDN